MNMKNDIDSIPDMAALRARIDQVDQQLISLLAYRTRLIDHAAQIKARENLPARIDDRVEQVANNARRWAAEQGVDPDLAERLWRTMVEHFIAQEETILSGDDPATKD
ncbi:chorismate mutase [Paracoccus pacificus]|uniref:chorismate mutase n=1 Tax=Paracoccus pacificus TaxID=1463598 RepID=A0ABW4R2T6_9RHOB